MSSPAGRTKPPDKERVLKVSRRGASASESAPVYEMIKCGSLSEGFNMKRS